MAVIHIPPPLTYLGRFQPHGPTQSSHLARSPEQLGGKGPAVFLFDASLDGRRGDGAYGHDEETCVCDRSAIWSVCGRVRKRFTTAGTILQAAWTQMEGSDEPVLCLLHNDSLTVASPSGLLTEVPLPWPLEALHPLPCGLLLQRAAPSAPSPSPSPSPATPVPPPASHLAHLQNPALAAGSARVSARDRLGRLPKPGWSAGEESSGERPGSAQGRGGFVGRRASGERKAGGEESVGRQRLEGPGSFRRERSTGRGKGNLLAMTHPQEEPREVGVLGQVGGLSEEERVVWSSPTAALLVSFHRGRQQHSAWRILQSPPSGVPSQPSLGVAGSGEGQGQVRLQQIWQQESGSFPSQKILLSNDEQGRPLLALLSEPQQQLLLVPLPLPGKSWTNDRAAWSMAAKSAEVLVSPPHRSTWGRRGTQRHLLVLTPTGELHLELGQLRLWSCPAPELSPGGPSGPSDSDTWHGLCDAVGDRVTLVSVSGQMHRFRVKLTAESPLVRACLAALRLGADPALYHRLLTALLSAPTLQNKESRRQGPLGGRGFQQAGGRDVGGAGGGEGDADLGMNDDVGVGEDGEGRRMSWVGVEGGGELRSDVDREESDAGEKGDGETERNGERVEGSVEYQRFVELKGDVEWAALTDVLLRWAAQVRRLRQVSVSERRAGHQSVPAADPLSSHVPNPLSQSFPSVASLSSWHQLPEDIPSADVRASSVGTSGGESGLKTGPGSGRAGTESAWKRLLESSRHRETHNRSLYRSLKPPAPPPPLQSPPKPAKPGSASSSGGGSGEVGAEEGREVSLGGLWGVLESLHAVYEDLKLDVLRWRELPKMARLLATLAASLGETDFCDFYARDSPGACVGLDLCPLDPMVPLTPAPSILHHLLHLIISPQATTKPGTLFGSNPTTNQTAGTPQGHPRTGPQVTPGGGPSGASPLQRQLAVAGPLADECVGWSQRITALYGILAEGGGGRRAAQRCVEAMVRLRVGLLELERLPPAVALPLRQALSTCRETPPPGWPAAAYVLVGRQDLAAQATRSPANGSAGPKGRSGKARRQSTGVAQEPGRRRQVSQAHRAALFRTPESPLAVSGEAANPSSQRGASDGEGERQVASSDSALLAVAPHGLHLRAVPLFPASQHAEGEEEGVAELAAAAAGVGPTRGGGGGASGEDGMEHMLGAEGPGLRFSRDLRLAEVRRLLSSSTPVAVRMGGAPDASDPDIVAQQQSQLMQLAQRTTALPLGRAAFTVATQRAPLTEALPIPKLVLAGRLPAQHDATVSLDASVGSLAELTAWPEFHNGVAAGLKIAPGQAGLSRTWIRYNRPEEPSSGHAGVLLALGLHRHLAVLPATDLYRYLAQEHDATTVAVLLGMAAAKRGSMDAATSKMLYLHIPTRHPPSFPELELPTLVQAAALMAVGLLYEASAHRLTTEILLAEIDRRPNANTNTTTDREGYALAAGLALGFVTLGQGGRAWGLADLRIEDRLQHLFSGTSESDEHRPRGAADALPAGMRPQESAQLSNGQILEGAMVSLDVTAPGATLALGLMYLKSNDAAVAARLPIPSTHYALEHVRPDFVLLRVVARGLILWDSVEATEAWIQAQVPAVMRPEPGTPVQGGSRAVVDREAAAQAHASVLTGACIAIGLRYAGTADAAARELLHRYALFFLRERRAAGKLGGLAGGGVFAGRVDAGTLEGSLDSVLLALSVVMAGTGHLGTLRLLRFLRRRSGSMSYGHHMAVSLATGFLFLGGGMRTFGRSNEAIAALLAALYPRLPSSASDHRCHLQALRHLWVLAVESRSLQAVDVDSGLPLLAPLEVTFQEASSRVPKTYYSVAPCLLPEAPLLKRVRVCGPRYWPQTLDLTQPEGNGSMSAARDVVSRGVVLVKRRLGARPHAESHLDSSSLHSETIFPVELAALGRGGEGPSPSLPGEPEQQELKSAFSADPSLLAFARLFCSSTNGTTGNHAGTTPGSPGAFERFCSMALRVCTEADQAALLPVYLALYSGVEALRECLSGKGAAPGTLCPLSLSLWNIQAMCAMTQQAGSWAGSGGPPGHPLVQRLWLAMLESTVTDSLTKYALEGPEPQTLEPAARLAGGAMGGGTAGAAEERGGPHSTFPAVPSGPGLSPPGQHGEALQGRPLLVDYLEGCLHSPAGGLEAWRRLGQEAGAAEGLRCALEWCGIPGPATLAPVLRQLAEVRRRLPLGPAVPILAILMPRTPRPALDLLAQALGRPTHAPPASGGGRTEGSDHLV